MEIEFIYTYLEREQEIVRRSISSKNLISKSCIADIAIHDLTSRERIDLKKLVVVFIFQKQQKLTQQYHNGIMRRKGSFGLRTGN